jgi:hypothetical protein
MTMTTYYSSAKELESYLPEGIACPFVRFNWNSLQYEIGYCVMNSNKEPRHVYIFNNTIQHIDLGNVNKLFMDLSREGYMRIYTTSLTEYLAWVITKDGVFETAHLIRMDNE